MDRFSKIELTNLCVITKDDKILVQEKILEDGTKGICFPGGHIENNECIIDSVKREIKEETGLIALNPIPCGYKDWINKDGSRYLVLVFKINKFTGELKDSDEGKVKFISIEEFKKTNTIWYMKEVYEMSLRDELNELFFPLDGSKPELIG